MASGYKVRRRGGRSKQIDAGQGSVSRIRERDSQIINSLKTQGIRQEQVRDKYASRLEKSWSKEEKNRQELASLENQAYETRRKAIEKRSQQEYDKSMAEAKQIQKEGEFWGKFSAKLGADLGKMATGMMQIEYARQRDDAMASAPELTERQAQLTGQLVQKLSNVNNKDSATLSKSGAPAAVIQAKAQQDPLLPKAQQDGAARREIPRIPQFLAVLDKELAERGITANSPSYLKEVQVRRLEIEQAFGLTSNTDGLVLFRKAYDKAVATKHAENIVDGNKLLSKKNISILVDAYKTHPTKENWLNLVAGVKKNVNPADGKPYATPSEAIAAAVNAVAPEGLHTNPLNNSDWAPGPEQGFGPAQPGRSLNDRYGPEFFKEADKTFNTRQTLNNSIRSNEVKALDNTALTDAVNYVDGKGKYEAEGGFAKGGYNQTDLEKRITAAEGQGLTKTVTFLKSMRAYTTQAYDKNQVLDLVQQLYDNGQHGEVQHILNTHPIFVNDTTLKKQWLANTALNTPLGAKPPKVIKNELFRILSPQLKGGSAKQGENHFITLDTTANLAVRDFYNTLSGYIKVHGNTANAWNLAYEDVTKRILKGEGIYQVTEAGSASEGGLQTTQSEFTLQLPNAIGVKGLNKTQIDTLIDKQGFDKAISENLIFTARNLKNWEVTLNKEGSIELPDLVYELADQHDMLPFEIVNKQLELAGSKARMEPGLKDIAMGSITKRQRYLKKALARATTSMQVFALADANTLGFRNEKTIGKNLRQNTVYSRQATEGPGGEVTYTGNLLSPNGEMINLSGSELPFTTSPEATENITNFANATGIDLKDFFIGNSPNEEARKNIKDDGYKSVTKKDLASRTIIGGLGLLDSEHSFKVNVNHPAYQQMKNLGRQHGIYCLANTCVATRL